MHAPLSVSEAIRNRPDVPRFDSSKPIPDAQIEELLQLACRASSRYHLQPWRLVLVRSTTNLRRLRRCTFGASELKGAQVGIILLGALHSEQSHLNLILSQMSAIAGKSPESVAEQRARTLRAVAGSDAERSVSQSVSVFAATLLIAAEGLGLHAWLADQFHTEQLRSLFGIPNDHVIVSVLGVGYGSSQVADLGRLPLQDICFEEHFGQPSILGQTRLKTNLYGEALGRTHDSV